MTQGAFQPKFAITNVITTGLTQIERARGFLEAATLSEQWVRAMGERALVLETLRARAGANAMIYYDKLRRRAMTSCDTIVLREGQPCP